MLVRKIFLSKLVRSLEMYSKFIEAFVLPTNNLVLYLCLSGKYHCPVTFKVFNENTHIVAVKPTGNVFAFEVSYMYCCVCLW